MRKIFFILLLCMIAVSVFAQGQFIVYSIKGSVTCGEGRRGRYLKADSRVSLTNYITVPEKGGITLLNKEGAHYSISLPGTYLASQLIDSFKKNNNPIINHFFRLLWEQGTKKVNDPDKRRKDYFDRPVIIRADLGDIWVSPELDTLNYSGIKGKFPLSWISIPQNKIYAFSLYNPPNTFTPFYRTLVKTQQIPVTDLATQMKPGNSYYWGVSSSTEENDMLYVFNYVTSQDLNKAITTINELKPSIEENAREAFRIAFMLEYTHYLAESYQYYAKAARLDPANTLYRSTLLSFEKEFNMQ